MNSPNHQSVYQPSADVYCYPGSQQGTSFTGMQSAQPGGPYGNVPTHPQDKFANYGSPPIRYYTQNVSCASPQQRFLYDSPNYADRSQYLYYPSNSPPINRTGLCPPQMRKQFNEYQNSQYINGFAKSQYDPVRLPSMDAPIVDSADWSIDHCVRMRTASTPMQRQMIMEGSVRRPQQQPINGGVNEICDNTAETRIPSYSNETDNTLSESDQNNRLQRNRVFKSNSPYGSSLDALTRVIEIDVNDIKRKQFSERLKNIWIDQGIKLRSLPTITKIPIDLFSLYKLVQEREGYTQVTLKKRWREIANLLGIYNCQSAAFGVKRNYCKLGILHYECIYDLNGADPDQILKEIENSKPPPNSRKRRRSNSKREAASAGDSSPNDTLLSSGNTSNDVTLSKFSPDSRFQIKVENEVPPNMDSSQIQQQQHQQQQELNYYSIQPCPNFTQQQINGNRIFQPHQYNSFGHNDHYEEEMNRSIDYNQTVRIVDPYDMRFKQEYCRIPQNANQDVLIYDHHQQQQPYHMHSQETDGFYRNYSGYEYPYSEESQHPLFVQTEQVKEENQSLREDVSERHRTFVEQWRQKRQNLKTDDFIRARELSLKLQSGLIVEVMSALNDLIMISTQSEDTSNINLQKHQNICSSLVFAFERALLHAKIYEECDKTQVERESPIFRECNCEMFCRKPYCVACSLALRNLSFDIENRQMLANNRLLCKILAHLIKRVDDLRNSRPEEMSCTHFAIIVLAENSLVILSNIADCIDLSTFKEADKRNFCNTLYRLASIDNLKLRGEPHLTVQLLAIEILTKLATFTLDNRTYMLDQCSEEFALNTIISITEWLIYADLGVSVKVELGICMLSLLLECHLENIHTSISNVNGLVNKLLISLLSHLREELLSNRPGAEQCALRCARSFRSLFDGNVEINGQSTQGGKLTRQIETSLLDIMFNCSTVYSYSTNMRKMNVSRRRRLPYVLQGSIDPCESISSLIARCLQKLKPNR